MTSRTVPLNKELPHRPQYLTSGNSVYSVHQSPNVRIHSRLHFVVHHISSQYKCLHLLISNAIRSFTEASTSHFSYSSPNSFSVAEATLSRVILVNYISKYIVAISKWVDENLLDFIWRMKPILYSSKQIKRDFGDLCLVKPWKSFHWLQPIW